MKKLLICKDLAIATSGTPFDLNQGQLGIWGKAADGTWTVTTSSISSSTYDECILAVGTATAGAPIISQPIKRKLATMNIEDYVAPVKKDVVYGFPGTGSRTLDITANEEPAVSLRTSYGYEEEYDETWTYPAAASPSEDTVFFNWLKQINGYPADEIVPAPARPADVKLLTDGTKTTTGYAGTTATYDSTTVTMSGAGHGISAGDIIAFGSADTSPVYKVASVNGVTIELESPFTETTSSSLTAYTVGTNSKWGLQFVSRVAGVDFKVDIREGITGDAETVNAAWTPGHGTIAQVQALENESIDGGDANLNRTWIPVRPDSEVDTSLDGYDIASIIVDHPASGRESGLNYEVRNVLRIAVPETTSTFDFVLTTFKSGWIDA